MTLMRAWNDDAVFDDFSAAFLGLSQYIMTEDFSSK